jgi:hypothetical protein
VRPAQRDCRLGLVTLILKRASASRPSGEWNDDDFDGLTDGIVVGRIMKAAAVPVGMHLNDRELDLLIAACLEEAKRRGRTTPSDQTVERASPTGKSSRKGQAEVARRSLNLEL